MLVYKKFCKESFSEKLDFDEALQKDCFVMNFVWKGRD